MKIQGASRKVMFQQESFPAVSSEGKPSTRDLVITKGPGVTKKSNLDFSDAIEINHLRHLGVSENSVPLHLRHLGVSENRLNP